MAATITYKHPVSGTTPPTVAQAKLATMLVVEVVTADADTTAVITHNWQLSAAALAKYFPIIQYYKTGSGTSPDTIIFTLTDSVSVTITTPTTVGSNATLVVILQKPHSLIK